MKRRFFALILVLAILVPQHSAGAWLWKSEQENESLWHRYFAGDTALPIADAAAFLESSHDPAEPEYHETPNSTAFSEVQYDAENRDLYVHFRNSGGYVYHEVPDKVWADFLDAESMGRFFNREIRNHYSCERSQWQKGSIPSE